ncbi:MAG TPA: heparan-alpha-glucosaminide N-acetyltransferase domain-containing protein [Rhodoferax sp.]|jgi:predicted acyltransferase|nr:heparan-alpha-glucosaminide N-acetyltransferase domain-containing protein [Rhodoferax sp.]HNV59774.1 heparan-alpha-glucosaminide N-acetyltransferase domain-containing protein [Rhodoferax sp.]HPW28259.1 heparan-alpha-glucosaminide N-acetyltransferase domain-containing protein [Rhodoferax sp.]
MKGLRLQSLDAFRGFTIAAMLVVNNPGDWGHLYAPLKHAAWDGWTFTDCIFPFFVFISGVSMTLSLSRRAALGDNRMQLLGQTVRRSATIIAIGLLLNFIPAFDLATLRIPGVLQRLGLCALLAAPIVLFGGWRTQLAWLVGLLVLYTGIQTWVAVPDASGVWHTGSWRPGEDVGAWLDRSLMDGHLWRASKTWDPEGLLSTIPAVASLLAGVLAGHGLASQRAASEKVVWMLVAGLGLLCLGQVVGAWSMPINKNLWSPAYTLFMAGWASLVLGLFYGVMDAWPNAAGRARAAQWAQPLVIFGMNALFLFALSGLIAKMLGVVKVTPQRTLKVWLFEGIQNLAWAPVNASLLFALLFTVFFYCIAWAMWRKGWFVKV